eukprot:gene2463-2801_t
MRTEIKYLENLWGLYIGEKRPLLTSIRSICRNRHIKDIFSNFRLKVSVCEPLTSGACHIFVTKLENNPSQELFMIRDADFIKFVPTQPTIQFPGYDREINFANALVVDINHDNSFCLFTHDSGWEDSRWADPRSRKIQVASKKPINGLSIGKYYCYSRINGNDPIRFNIGADNMLHDDQGRLAKGKSSGGFSWLATPGDDTMIFNSFLANETKSGTFAHSSGGFKKSDRPGVTLTASETAIVNGFVHTFATALTTYDFNKDAKIDRNELTQVLIRYGAQYDQASMSVNNIFNILDVNRDNFIDINDILTFNILPQQPQSAVQPTPVGQGLTATETAFVQGLVSNFSANVQATDLNRDGQIDRNEMVQMLLRANTPYDMANTMVNNIFRALDRDNNGVINYTDIQLYNQNPSGFQQQPQPQPQYQQPQQPQQPTTLTPVESMMIQGVVNNYVNTLNSCDTNRDGAIDRNELTQALMRAGTAADQVQAMCNKMFQILDKDNNVQLSPTEQAMVQGFKQNFAATLQNCDTNRDGMIDRNELTQVLLRANTPYDMANTMVNNIFRALDRDNNGVINMTDIMN